MKSYFGLNKMLFFGIVLDKCQCKCKKYRTCKKYYSWNPSTCICENSKHSHKYGDSANGTIIISKSVTSTVSINSDDKN